MIPLTDEQHNKRIGNAIKHFRQNYKNPDKPKTPGLTQTQLAQRIFVTFQQVQKYEKNSNDLGLWNFVVYCKKFDVNPGMVISQALDNMYLPEQLIEEGKIQVTTETMPVKSKPVNIFEIEKNEND